MDGGGVALHPHIMENPVMGLGGGGGGGGGSFPLTTYDLTMDGLLHSKLILDIYVMGSCFFL